MKTLLIHPPAGRMIPSILPDEVESGRGHNPPLGLLYIAGSLRNRGGHEVGIIDAQAEGIGYEELEKRISNAAPDVVGITALSFTMPDVLSVCAMAKKAGATTVLGGPHAHIFSEETALLDNVDYAMRGECEKTFCDLMDRISEKSPPVNVPGATWSENGSVLSGPEPCFIDDLDELPHPARDMLDPTLYTSVLAITSPITTAMSSRGCPYRCIFCDRPHLGRKFRYRSAGSVVDEIEECVGLGVRELLFYDDNFATDKNRAMEIAEEIIRRELDVIIDARLRVTDLDTDLAEALRRAGCDRVHLGVESGDPDILKRLKKGITLDDAVRAFDTARRAGLRSLAYFMIGSPGETRETASRTVDFARKLKPDYVHFSLLIPFPGTELYGEGVERGMWNGDPWLEFALEPREDFVPPVWDENLDRNQLAKLTLDAYRSFYRDPAYLLRRLRKVRSFDEVLRQARAGLKIFRL